MKNESASRITNDLTYNFRTKRSDCIFHTSLKLGKSVEILNQSNGPCSIGHLAQTLIDPYNLKQHTFQHTLE